MERVIFADVTGLISNPDAQSKPAGQAENMHHRAKAVKLSFLLHALLIGSAVIMHGQAVPVPEQLVIDFTVERAEAIMEKPAEPDRAQPALQQQATPPAAILPAAPLQPGKNKAEAARDRAAKHQRQKTAQQERVRAVARPADNMEKPAEPDRSPPPAGEQATAGAALAAALPAGPEKNEGLQAITPAAGNQADTAQGLVAADNGAGGPANEERQYLRQNFDHIRSLIMRNLSFPAGARKLGWTGKMRVSFIIREDGGVEGITIVSGSGHEVLDMNVITAIRRTAPFPQPPVKAQFILPIAYSLK
ncbi:MAG: TonB family protein [Desulfobulbaceae bacterium]|nr:TonB family protein [Desulfobulbaceae bacterium]